MRFILCYFLKPPPDMAVGNSTAVADGMVCWLSNNSLVMSAARFCTSCAVNTTGLPEVMSVLRTRSMNLRMCRYLVSSTTSRLSFLLAMERSLVFVTLYQDHFGVAYHFKVCSLSHSIPTSGIPGSAFVCLGKDWQ